MASLADLQAFLSFLGIELPDFDPGGMAEAESSAKALEDSVRGSLRSEFEAGRAVARGYSGEGAAQMSAALTAMDQALDALVASAEGLRGYLQETTAQARAAFENSLAQAQLGWAEVYAALARAAFTHGQSMIQVPAVLQRVRTSVGNILASYHQAVEAAGSRHLGSGLGPESVALLRGLSGLGASDPGRGAAVPGAGGRGPSVSEAGGPVPVSEAGGPVPGSSGSAAAGSQGPARRVVADGSAAVPTPQDHQTTPASGLPAVRGEGTPAEVDSAGPVLIAVPDPTTATQARPARPGAAVEPVVESAAEPGLIQTGRGRAGYAEPAGYEAESGRPSEVTAVRRDGSAAGPAAERPTAVAGPARSESGSGSDSEKPVESAGPATSRSVKPLAAEAEAEADAESAAQRRSAEYSASAAEAGRRWNTGKGPSAGPKAAEWNRHLAAAEELLKAHGAIDAPFPVRAGKWSELSEDHRAVVVIAGELANGRDAHAERLAQHAAQGLVPKPRLPGGAVAGPSHDSSADPADPATADLAAGPPIRTSLPGGSSGEGPGPVPEQFEPEVLRSTPSHHADGPTPVGPATRTAEPGPTVRVDAASYAMQDPGTGSSRRPATPDDATGSDSGPGIASGRFGPDPLTGRDDSASDRSTTTPAVSSAVRDWGAAREGVIGFVHIDPLPAKALEVLHREIAQSVFPADEGPNATRTAFRARLAEHLTPTVLADLMPELRSDTGAAWRIEGHTLRLRLQLTDPRPSRSAPGEDGTADLTTFKVEKRTVGSADSRDGQTTSNFRTFGGSVPILWPGGEGSVLAGRLTPTAALTHNAMSTSAAAGNRLSHLTILRSRDIARPFDFGLNWEFRVEQTPRQTWRPAVPEPVDGAWRSAAASGTVRVIMPDHLADRVAVTPEDGIQGQAVQTLDDLPYIFESLKDPGRLLREVESHLGEEMAGISATSKQVLDQFLGEKSLRGNFPLMNSGAYVSPVLFDRGGAPWGVLRIHVGVPRLEALFKTGPALMENHTLKETLLSGAVTITSGLDVGLQGEVDFTASTESGHQTASSTIGGFVAPRYGAGIARSHTVGRSSVSVRAHSIGTEVDEHLLAQGDLSVRLELVRPGRQTVSHDLPLWENAALIRVHSRARAEGAVAAEPRILPPEIHALESLGASSVPHRVEGAEAMLDEGERWLAENGFLPSETRGGQTVSGAQLSNYRRWMVARSPFGLRAAMDDAIDGGSSIWFDKPGALTTERVELRLSITRSQEEPAYLRTVEGAITLSLTGVDATVSESRSASLTHTAAASSGVGVPGGAGFAPLDGSATRSRVRTNGAGGGGGETGVLISAGGLDVFTMPLSFRLDVYSGDAAVPVRRFSGAEGRMELYVPDHRTTSNPGQGQEQRLSTTVVPDTKTLERIRSSGYSVPNDAWVEFVAGSGELKAAYHAVLAGRDPSTVQAGAEPSRPSPDARPAVEGPRGLLAAAWEPVSATLFGTDPRHAGTALQQFGRSALSTDRIAGEFHQAHGGGVVTELLNPGKIVDHRVVVKLEAFIGEPTLVPGDGRPGPNGMIFTVEQERNAQTSHGTTSATGHQAGGYATGSGTAVAGVDVTGRLRYGQGKQAVEGRTGSTATNVAQTPVYGDPIHLKADVHFVMTVTEGFTNGPLNAIGIGPSRSTTVLVTKPGGVQFALNGHQIRAYGNVLGSVAETLGDALPALGTAHHMPERVTADRQFGIAAAGSLDPHLAARLRSEITDAVNDEAPGVLTVGHPAYFPQADSLLAAAVSPAELRNLATAGSPRTIGIPYLHAGGGVLLKVTLTAAPAPGFERTIGHELANDGLEGMAAHAPANESVLDSSVKVRTVSATGAVDHPDLRGSFDGRSALTAAVTRQTAAVQSVGHGSDGGTSLQTAGVTAFTVPMVFRVQVETQPFINVLNQVGPSVARLARRGIAWVLPRREPVSDRTVEGSVRLLFASAECPVARPAAAGGHLDPEPAGERLAVGLHRTDPFDNRDVRIDMPDPGAPPADPVRSVPRPGRFQPTGDFVVHGFNGIQPLREALREVVPDLYTVGAHWPDSPSTLSLILERLLRDGRMVIGNDQGEFGPASGPPRPGRAVTLTATLSGLEPVNTGVVRVERADGAGSSALSIMSAVVNPSLSVGPVVHTDPPAGFGASFAAFNHTGSAHSASAITAAGRRDVLKSSHGPEGNTSEWRADLVLALEAPGLGDQQAERRWVTGTLYLRTPEIPETAEAAVLPSPEVRYIDVEPASRVPSGPGTDPGSGSGVADRGRPSPDGEVSHPQRQRDPEPPSELGPEPEPRVAAEQRTTRGMPARDFAANRPWVEISTAVRESFSRRKNALMTHHRIDERKYLDLVRIGTDRMRHAAGNTGFASAEVLTEMLHLSTFNLGTPQDFARLTALPGMRDALLKDVSVLGGAVGQTPAHIGLLEKYPNVREAVGKHLVPDRVHREPPLLDVLATPGLLDLLESDGVLRNRWVANTELVQKLGSKPQVLRAARDLSVWAMTGIVELPGLAEAVLSADSPAGSLIELERHTELVTVLLNRPTEGREFARHWTAFLRGEAFRQELRSHAAAVDAVVAIPGLIDDMLKRTGRAKAFPELAALAAPSAALLRDVLPDVPGFAARLVRNKLLVTAAEYPNVASQLSLDPSAFDKVSDEDLRHVLESTPQAELQKAALDDIGEGIDKKVLAGVVAQSPGMAHLLSESHPHRDDILTALRKQPQLLAGLRGVGLTVDPHVIRRLFQRPEVLARVIQKGPLARHPGLLALALRRPLRFNHFGFLNAQISPRQQHIATWLENAVVREPEIIEAMADSAGLLSHVADNAPTMPVYLRRPGLLKAASLDSGILALLFPRVNAGFFHVDPTAQASGAEAVDLVGLLRRDNANLARLLFKAPLLADAITVGGRTDSSAANARREAALRTMAANEGLVALFADAAVGELGSGHWRRFLEEDSLAGFLRQAEDVTKALLAQPALLSELIGRWDPRTSPERASGFATVATAALAARKNSKNKSGTGWSQDLRTAIEGLGPATLSRRGLPLDPQFQQHLSSLTRGSAPDAGARDAMSAPTAPDPITAAVADVTRLLDNRPDLREAAKDDAYLREAMVKNPNLVKALIARPALARVVEEDADLMKAVGEEPEFAEAVAKNDFLYELLTDPVYDFDKRSLARTWQTRSVVVQVPDYLRLIRDFDLRTAIMLNEELRNLVSTSPSVTTAMVDQPSTRATLRERPDLVRVVRGAAEPIRRAVMSDPELFGAIAGSRPEASAGASAESGRPDGSHGVDAKTLLDRLAGLPALAVEIGDHQGLLDADGYQRLLTDDRVYSALAGLPEATMKSVASNARLFATVVAQPGLATILRDAEAEDLATAISRNEDLPKLFAQHGALVEALTNSPELRSALASRERLAGALLRRPEVVADLLRRPALASAFRVNRLMVDEVLSGPSRLWTAVSRNPVLSLAMKPRVMQRLRDRPRLLGVLETGPLAEHAVDQATADRLQRVLSGHLGFFLEGQPAEVVAAFLTRPQWQDRALEDTNAFVQAFRTIAGEPGFEELLSGEPEALLARLSPGSGPAAAGSRPPASADRVPAPGPAAEASATPRAHSAARPESARRAGPSTSQPASEVIRAFDASSEAKDLLLGPDGAVVVENLEQSPELLALILTSPDLASILSQQLATVTDPGARAEILRDLRFRTDLDQAPDPLPEFDLAFSAYRRRVDLPGGSLYSWARNLARVTYDHVVVERARIREERVARFDPLQPATWEFSGQIHYTSQVDAKNLSPEYLRELTRVATDGTGIRESEVRLNVPLHIHVGSGGASVVLVVDPVTIKITTINHAESSTRSGNDYKWKKYGGGHHAGPASADGLSDHPLLVASREFVSAHSSRSRKASEAAGPPAAARATVDDGTDALFKALVQRHRSVDRPQGAAQPAAAPPAPAAATGRRKGKSKGTSSAPPPKPARTVAAPGTDRGERALTALGITMAHHAPEWQSRADRLIARPEPTDPAGRLTAARRRDLVAADLHEGMAEAEIRERHRLTLTPDAGPARIQVGIAMTDSPGGVMDQGLRRAAQDAATFGNVALARALDANLAARMFPKPSSSAPPRRSGGRVRGWTEQFGAPLERVQDQRRWLNSDAADAEWFDPVAPVSAREWEILRTAARGSMSPGAWDAVVQRVNVEEADVLRSSQVQVRLGADGRIWAQLQSITGVIAYDHRLFRHGENGEHRVVELTTRVALVAEPGSGVSAAQIAAVGRTIRAGVDQIVNRGYRLPGGERLQARVEFVHPAAAGPDTAPHLVVEVTPPGTSARQDRFPADISPSVAGHEFAHLWGAKDDGRNPVTALAPFGARGEQPADSVMGPGGHDDDARLLPRTIWAMDQVRRSQIRPEDGEILIGPLADVRVPDIGDSLAGAGRRDGDGPAAGNAGLGSRGMPPKAGSSRDHGHGPSRPARLVPVPPDARFHRAVEIPDELVFQAALEREGLVTLYVPRDGDCLPNALLATGPELFGGIRDAQAMRRDLADALLAELDLREDQRLLWPTLQAHVHAAAAGRTRNEQNILPLLPALQGDDVRRELAGHLATPGVWAGEAGDIFLAVAAARYGFTAGVFWPDGRHTDLHDRYGGRPHLDLVHPANHWDGTEPAGRERNPALAGAAPGGLVRLGRAGGGDGVLLAMRASLRARGLEHDRFPTDDIIRTQAGELLHADLMFGSRRYWDLVDPPRGVIRAGEHEAGQGRAEPDVPTLPYQAGPAMTDLTEFPQGAEPDRLQWELIGSVAVPGRQIRIGARATQALLADLHNVAVTVVDQRTGTAHTEHPLGLQLEEGAEYPTVYMVHDPELGHWYATAPGPLSAAGARDLEAADPPRLEDAGQAQRLAAEARARLETEARAQRLAAERHARRLAKEARARQREVEVDARRLGRARARQREAAGQVQRLEADRNARQIVAAEQDRQLGAAHLQQREAADQVQRLEADMHARQNAVAEDQQLEAAYDQHRRVVEQGRQVQAAAHDRQFVDAYAQQRQATVLVQRLEADRNARQIAEAEQERQLEAAYLHQRQAAQEVEQLATAEQGAQLEAAHLQLRGATEEVDRIEARVRLLEAAEKQQPGVAVRSQEQETAFVRRLEAAGQARHLALAQERRGQLAEQVQRLEADRQARQVAVAERELRLDTTYVQQRRAVERGRQAEAAMHDRQLADAYAQRNQATVLVQRLEADRQARQIAEAEQDRRLEAAYIQRRQAAEQGRRAEPGAQGGQLEAARHRLHETTEWVQRLDAAVRVRHTEAAEQDRLLDEARRRLDGAEELARQLETAQHLQPHGARDHVAPQPTQAHPHLDEQGRRATRRIVAEVPDQRRAATPTEEEVAEVFARWNADTASHHRQKAFRAAEARARAQADRERRIQSEMRVDAHRWREDPQLRALVTQAEALQPPTPEWNVANQLINEHPGTQPMVPAGFTTIDPDAALAIAVQYAYQGFSHTARGGRRTQLRNFIQFYLKNNYQTRVPPVRAMMTLYNFLNRILRDATPDDFTLFMRRLMALLENVGGRLRLPAQHGDQGEPGP